MEYRARVVLPVQSEREQRRHCEKQYPCRRPVEGSDYRSRCCRRPSGIDDALDGLRAWYCGGPGSEDAGKRSGSRPIRQSFTPERGVGSDLSSADEGPQGIFPQWSHLTLAAADIPDHDSTP